MLDRRNRLRERSYAEPEHHVLSSVTACGACAVPAMTKERCAHLLVHASRAQGVEEVMSKRVKYVRVRDAQRTAVSTEPLRPSLKFTRLVRRHQRKQPSPFAV